MKEIILAACLILAAAVFATASVWDFREETPALDTETASVSPQLLGKVVCCYKLTTDESGCDVMPGFRCRRLGGHTVEDCFECKGYFDSDDDP